MFLQRGLDPLHEGQHALLLQALPNDLDGDGEPMHAIGIVMPIRALGHAVQVLEPKRRRGRQLIQRAVHVGHGKNSAAVVELFGLSRGVFRQLDVGDMG